MFLLQTRQICLYFRCIVSHTMLQLYNYCMCKQYNLTQALLRNETVFDLHILIGKIWQGYWLTVAIWVNLSIALPAWLKPDCQAV